jgi:hypothetical protein
LAKAAKLLAICPDEEVRDPSKALEYAQRACDLTGRSDPQALDALGAAHYALGQLEEAVKAARQAVRAALGQGDQELAYRIRLRLRAYRAQLAAATSQPATTGPAQ